MSRTYNTRPYWVRATDPKNKRRKIEHSMLGHHHDLSMTSSHRQDPMVDENGEPMTTTRTRSVIKYQVTTIQPYWTDYKWISERELQENHIDLWTEIAKARMNLPRYDSYSRTLIVGNFQVSTMIFSEKYEVPATNPRIVAHHEAGCDADAKIRSATDLNRQFCSSYEDRNDRRRGCYCCRQMDRTHISSNSERMDLQLQTKLWNSGEDLD